MICVKSIPIENPIAIYFHKKSTSKTKKDEQITYKALFEGNENDFFFYSVIEEGTRNILSISRIIFEN